MKTIYVGMSGGVDSSLTAALLKQKGYSVVGVYMKNWAQDIGSWHCPWKEDLNDAKRVAVQLDIPFKIFDFQKEYKQKVVDYLISEYQAGQTPNPDIMCNQEVKFKLFLEAALADGADMIATGHYARISSGDDPKLLKAVDESKDQSYFLYRIDQKALKKTLFPLGDISKSDVRKQAKKLGLVTADKKDSVGICFVGKIGIKEFLLNYVDAKDGPIIDQSGKKIGKHDGALFYTIGQRHGLNIGGGLPYYVVNKNVKTNTIFVTTDLDDPDLWTSSFELHDHHWISDAPDDNKTYQLRVRHLGELFDVNVKDNQVAVKDQIRALTPGQSAVIYDGDVVLGGGIIAKHKN